MARCSNIDYEIPVDSKGLCFFCLKPCTNLEHVSSRNLKQILAYLKVDVKKLLNFSPQFVKLLGLKLNTGIKATLCSGCSTVNQKFNKWYQEYEKIQIHLQDCIQSVHQLIKEGDQNPSRVTEYGKRMLPQKPEEVFSSSFVVNLRIETFKNCTSLLDGRFPKVNINIPVTTQNQNDISEDEQSVSENDVKPPLTSEGEDFVETKPKTEPGLSTSPAFVANNANLHAPLPVKKGRPRKQVLVLSAGGKQNFKCRSCSKVFMYEGTFKRHLTMKKCNNLGLRKGRSVKKKVFKCTICVEEYDSLASLQTHMAIHKYPRIDNKKTQCSSCGFFAAKKVALSQHKTDIHLVELVKNSLKSTVSDVEFGQVIDLIFYQMVKSGTCFKCKHKYPRRKGNLKYHVVNDHFKDFVKLVDSQTKSRYVNDGRNQSIVEYLGIIVPTSKESQVEVKTEEEENIPPVERIPNPGYSRNVGRGRKRKMQNEISPQQMNKRSHRIPIPRTRAHQRVTRTSQGLRRHMMKKKRKIVKKHEKKPLSHNVPNPHYKQAASTSASGNNSRRSQSQGLSSNICPKCFHSFYDNRNLTKHLPICKGQKRVKNPSETPKSIYRYPGPSAHPKIKKLYAIEQSRDGMFNCPLCPYGSMKSILIKYHLACKHLPQMLHMALKNPSQDINECVIECKGLLKEMGAEGSERKKCFSCNYSDISLSRLKDHLVNDHFDELVEEIENRFLLNKVLEGVD